MDGVLQGLEHLNHDVEEERKPSISKKITLIGTSIVLALLVVSYILAGPISDIIRGQLGSNPLEHNSIELDDFSIIFEEGTHQQLQEMYFTEQKVEFSVCLLGKKKGSDYYINQVYQPRMVQQAFNHVIFEPCSSETLIMLHTHPYKSCLASATDIRTLEKTKERNPDVLMVVMCEPARFSVYG